MWNKSLPAHHAGLHRASGLTEDVMPQIPATKPHTPIQGRQGSKANDPQEEAEVAVGGRSSTLALPRSPLRTPVSLSWSGAKLSMMMSFFRSSSMVDL